MKVTVTKKGAGKKLAGKRRKAGEVFETGSRYARVFCAVGLTVAGDVSPRKKKPEKKTEKKTKKKASKKTYKTTAMTAESSESDS